MSHPVYTFFPDKTNTKRMSIERVKQTYRFTGVPVMASNTQNETKSRSSLHVFILIVELTVRQRFLNCGPRTPRGQRVYLRQFTNNSSINTETDTINPNAICLILLTISQYRTSFILLVWLKNVRRDYTEISEPAIKPLIRDQSIPL